MSKSFRWVVDVHTGPNKGISYYSEWVSMKKYPQAEELLGGYMYDISNGTMRHLTLAGDNERISFNLHILKHCVIKLERS